MVTRYLLKPGGGYDTFTVKDERRYSDITEIPDYVVKTHLRKKIWEATQVLETPELTLTMIVYHSDTY